MKSYLSVILDTIFCFIIALLLSFILLNYFLPSSTSLILSFLLASIFSFLVLKILLDKRKGALDSVREIKEKENLMLELNFLPHKSVLSHFYTLFERLNYKVYIKGKYLCFKDKPVVLRFSYSFSKVEKEDVVCLLNDLSGEQTGYILAPQFSQEIMDFTKRFSNKIVLVNGEEVYKFLKQHDALLPQKFSSVKERKNRGVWRNFLKKKKAKNFLVLGLIFLFMSYFVPIKAYYVICGCLFLSYSLFLRLFGRAETKA